MHGPVGTLFAFLDIVLSRVGSGVLALSLLPACAVAQETVPTIPVAPIYVPPTVAERVHWVVQGTASIPVIGVNAIDSAWSTRVNWPEEWGRGPKGFARRFADETAYGTISDAIEAGVGTLWGEDPRYQRAAPGSHWRRVRHALTATVLAPRRDGRTAPAWGRFGAIAAATEIQNTWLPPSARTPGAVAWRVADDLIWRAAANVWDEFWPDLRRRVPPSVR
jgi:hypothetical protein